MLFWIELKVTLYAWLKKIFRLLKKKYNEEFKKKKRKEKEIYKEVQSLKKN